MSRATVVEVDFFGMDKETSAKTRFQKLYGRTRSFQGIQSAISKINPEIRKTVIASGSAVQVSKPRLWDNNNIDMLGAPPPTTKCHRSSSSFHSLPLYRPPPPAAAANYPTSSSSSSSSYKLMMPNTTPMTIFYNGTVTVFDLPPDKAEDVLKLAEKENCHASPDQAVSVASADLSHLLRLDSLQGDLPIARRKSLQRFLQKRKERLTFVSPYPYAPDADNMSPEAKSTTVATTYQYHPWSTIKEDVFHVPAA